jgi:hypothetical protein
MITLTIINILVSFLLIAGCAEFARGGVAERAVGADSVVFAAEPRGSGSGVRDRLELVAL